ncbi:PAS domain S-box protein [Halobaculum sp. EA56]|uniref:PAS domain S-box protein n=1 Tax=Halobaculum sp. EA56 TaxID=3421648 RepID=UPI003EB7D519
MSEQGRALKQTEAYSRLYEIMRSGRPLFDRFEAILQLGVEYFGVDHGYITQIEQERNEWTAIVSTDSVDGPIPPGLELALTTSYCRRTIQNEGIVSFADALDAGWEDDPAFETHQLSCYHGAPIVVDDEPFGTVCFSAQDPRAEPFTEAEKSFTYLIAQVVGYEIGQRNYERDLAERERTLAERREIYRAVIDASFDLLFRIDLDGEFTYHSPSVEELLGYTPDELRGRQFTVVLPDAETAETAQALYECVLAGETVEETYLPLETKSGEVVYADIRGTPIYDADVPPADRMPVDIVAVQGMSRDATDRKRRDRLISVIHRVLRHNLRNDMGVIRGYTELLEDSLTGDDAELAQRIHNTAERLIDLSETAQKLEENLDAPPQPEPIDVVPLVSRAATQIDEAHSGASITVDTPNTAVAQTAPRLETAIWELVDNAATHAGDKPTVTVEIAVTDDEVVVRVLDDGPGLPDIEQSVLLSGEETPLVHGQRLGLWLVYWIVTSLDGELDVLEEQPGAAIEIRLPAAS